MDEQKETVDLSSNPNVQKVAADIQGFLNSLEEQKKINDAVDADLAAGVSVDNETIDIDDNGNIVDDSDDSPMEDFQTDSSTADLEVEDTISEDDSDVSEEEIEDLY